jgi:CRISPR-associated endonuclease/helicase Cas3
VLNYEECDGHPFLQKCHSDTAVHFYISNTAKIAQLGYIFNQDEGSYCFHSKFTTLDKKKVFEDIYNDFKQNGNRSKNVLRSGPVVQASLNITCDEMHSEPCSPENMLQRVGRLDRFGENSAVNTYNIYTPNSFIEGKKSCNLARFLSRQDNYSSSFSWLAYLNNSDVDEVNIASLYQLYDQFYDKHDVKEKLANELMITLEKGVKAINRSIFDPLLVKKQPNSSKKVAKKNSLRGNSRFVQMACVDLSQLDEIVYAERYATQLSDDNTLTYAVDAIRGYDDSEKDCLAFMHKKHHKLYGGKKEFKSDLLLDRARTSDLPVYLSYIPGVLSEIHEKAFEGAIYYGFNDHQPIGAINQEQINQLKHGE